MKKIKKFVAVVLLSLTLFNTTFNSYVMTVQATEVLTMTVVDALLAMFGLELGLGNQTDFFCNSEFTDFVDAVADGRTVNMPIYGDVNFSDGESILSWLSWAQHAYDKVDGNNVVDIAFNTAIITLSKALDKTSYSSTGSSATNVMRNRIDILKDYYNTATDFVGEVKEAFSSMNGTGDGKMTRTRWDIITGMLSCFMCGAADTVTGFADALVHPADTVYQNYDTAFDETKGYVLGAEYLEYRDSADPSLADYSDHYVMSRFWNQSNGNYGYVITPISETLNFFMIKDETYGWYGFYTYDSEKNCIDDCKGTVISYDLDRGKWYHNSDALINYGATLVYTICCPVFGSEESARAFWIDGDTTGILNLADTSAYPAFKDEVGITTDDIADMIKQLIDAIPSVDDIAAAMPRVLDKTADIAGTQNAILSVTAAIADIAGIIIDSQVQDNANTNSILSAIGALALNWKDLFKWLDDFWTWLKNAWAELVALIGAAAVAGHPNGSVDSDDSSSSSGSVSLINGLIMLISIFFILLRIFLHLLEFIINIFRIPAAPGFIMGDFAVGFNYIKSVQLAPLSISIYDFLMGLVHILLLFSVVKVLKKHIDRIHM